MVLGTPARAAFEDPLWSARVASLGGAFTAVGDDPIAAFYNPAAAIRLEKKSVQFTYAKLFAGLDDVNLSLNNLAYGHPLTDKDVITAGWGSVSASNLRREDTLTLGYAHRFPEVPGVGNVGLGASLRYLSQSFTLDARTAGDPVFQDGRSRQDAAVDLHAYLEEVGAPGAGLSAGLSVRAINRPDVGFSAEDKLPLETSIGFLYRWRKWSFPADIVLRDGEMTPEIGVETLMAEDRLAVRAGTDTDQVGAGLGYRHVLGGRFTLSFDYAFLWPLKIEDTSGSHRATIGVEF